MINQEIFEGMNMKKEKEISKKNIERKKRSLREEIEDIIYICILAPLVFVTIHIVFVSITKPNVIPDVFGYKLFMILDENVHNSLEYGDLVFTKNTDTNMLKHDDVIAYRNEMNTVTICKIKDIKEISEVNKESNENDYIKIFIVENLENELSIREEKVEGLLVHRIPKIGKIIYFIQKPIVTIGIEVIILIIGLICMNIAGRLDQRDERILEQQSKNANN